MAEAEFPPAAPHPGDAESHSTHPDNGDPAGVGGSARPEGRSAQNGGQANGRSAALDPRHGYSFTSPPPDPAEALYYEGMAAYQHRNWEQALERFRRLKALQPSRPGLDALLDEVQWFLQLQEAAPTEPAALTPAGRERTPLARRKPGGAWRVWGVSLIGLVGVVALLLVALQVGAPGSAARSWRSFLPWNKASEQDAQELFNRGETRLAAGDYEGAQDAFRELLAITPDDPQARSGLARAERQQTLAQDYATAEAAIAEENWDAAAEVLDKILAVEPGYAEAQARADFVAQRRRLAGLYEEGSRLYDLAQWNAALEQFEKIRALDGSYRTEAIAEFLFVCYLNAGQQLVEDTGDGQPAADLPAVEQAVEFFSRALSIHPRNRTATEARRLGGLYLEALRTLAQDNRAEAITRLQALVTEAQASELAGFGKGRIAQQLYLLILADADDAVRRGDVPAAIELYRRGQALPVDDVSAAVQGEALARAVTATPTPRPTETPSPVPTPRPLAVVSPDPVNARAGPGSNYPVIGSVPAGSELEITGRRADGLWLRVCCVTRARDGRAVEGWLPATLVEVRGDASAVAIVTPAPPPTAEPAPAQPTAPPATLVCIAGQMRDTKGGAPLAGWTVTLEGPGGSASAATDSAGNYRFDNLAPGSYSVAEQMQDGWRAVSPNPTVVVPAASDACVTVDFWNEKSESSGPTPTPRPR